MSLLYNFFSTLILAKFYNPETFLFLFDKFHFHALDLFIVFFLHPYSFPVLLRNENPPSSNRTTSDFDSCYSVVIRELFARVFPSKVEQCETRLNKMFCDVYSSREKRLKIKTQNRVQKQNRSKIADEIICLRLKWFKIV